MIVFEWRCDIQLNDARLNVFLLSCQMLVLYFCGECRSDECIYAKCRGALLLEPKPDAKFLSNFVHFRVISKKKILININFKK
jgi:hypothetical protein